VLGLKPAFTPTQKTHQKPRQKPESFQCSFLSISAMKRCRFRTGRKYKRGRGRGRGNVPNKLDGLQALRAFAAIIVVLEHCSYRGSILAHAQPPAASPLGAIGVQLFFVLSGLLMGRILLRGYDPLFLAARALRIFPPYWAAVVVGAFLCAAVGASWTFDWKAFYPPPRSMIVSTSPTGR
jgi:peptidoglycan/LPS O-acetylase OafA/YrhL